MNTITRIELIKDCLNLLGGEIVGGKKLHKLVYLCQAKGIDFGQNFIFHFYGVYSPTLSVDLELAARMGILIEETSGSAIKIKLKEKGNSDVEYIEAVEKKDFIKMLASQSANVLEVLSTLIYLRLNGFSDERLRSKLQELKGHLKAHFPKAIKLAMEYYETECN